MTASNMNQSTKEERKLRKPLIERKRRERINHCLEQLRETVVGAFRLDQSKLEKADILEMTVKHLQNIQSNKLREPMLDSADTQQRYSTGYIQCMHEVHNLLLSCDWMDKTLGSRLLNHLLKSLPKPCPIPANQQCCNATETEGPGSCPASPVAATRAAPPCHIRGHAHTSRPHPTESLHMTALEMWRPW